MKKCPSSIRCWDSEPLDQGVSRPVLLLLARNALAYTKCWLTDLGSFVDGPCKWIFGCLNNAFAQLHNLSLSVFFSLSLIHIHQRHSFPFLVSLPIFLIFSSVTRFGEILTLWKNHESIWHFFRVICYWAKFSNLPLWHKNCDWANFDCCKWPNTEQII